MIHITAPNANDAWIQTFKTLLTTGSDTGNSKYYRDETASIEVTSPDVIAKDSHFPMTQQELDVINDFIYSGENEEGVVHEWTKLYHHRAFDQPNSQIEFMIEKLQAPLPVGEAIISMWDKSVDQDQQVAPCTLVVWGRIKHGKLEFHVHAHSSDAYKKLLMNILEFISLQKYVASRLGVEMGSYYHFLDSVHLHTKDLAAIEKLAIDLK